MEPLFSHFGEAGDFNKWDRFSTGQFTLPDGWEAEEGTHLWFQKNQSPQYETKIPDWEFTDSWKGMDKHMASLQGPTFSHFKAPIKGSIVSVVHSLMGLIPLLLGFAPMGWCKAVTSMIPK